MSQPGSQVDLIVVGAGTAGAACALHAARAGMSVVVLSDTPLDQAGAQWVNGVTRSAFEMAGVPAPEGRERRSDCAPFHLVAPSRRHRVTLRDHDLLDVDMRLLGARLRDGARSAGADLREGHRALGVDADERGVAVHTSAGVLRARHAVDASGLGGARLLGQAKVPRRDLCTAAQAVFEVADPAGASAFLDEHELKPGETICFAGIAGGYSILNVRVEGDEVDVLTGSIPADGHASGRAVLDDFVASAPWIGARRFGGQRAIPLGRPRETMAAGPVAAIGDAAGQVFSAHGSGIGPGMVAAKLLADTLSQGGSPTDYAAAWTRRHGGLFAAFDAFRKFSQELPPEELTLLVETGILDEELATAGLCQRFPRLGFGALADKIPSLVRAPRLAWRLSGTVTRIGALLALYPARPRSVSSGPGSGWSKLVAAAAGDRAWLGA